ncbi:MAG: hypothetical protein AB7O38_22330 [Pirellulaceae bacterium]
MDQRANRNSEPWVLERRWSHFPFVVCLCVSLLAVWVHTAARTVRGQELSLEDSDAGYIDNAVVRNRVRFRFDSAYDNPFADRAEFFYPTCGCFPGAPGPPQPESSVDYQELEASLEYVWTVGTSAFVEFPVRFINPVANDNTAGLSDIRVGIKHALIEGPGQWLTFQLRAFAPTGDGDKGLGTAHPSLEPALLFQRDTDRLSVFGEVRAWIPIDANKEEFPLSAALGGPGGTIRSYSGTILRYGLGAGYDLSDSPNVDHPIVTTLVTELVGWTILDGLKERTLTPFEPIENPPGVLNPNFLEEYASARGDTIVNIKVGIRLSTSTDTLYVGYGHALTSDQWYQNMLRVEYSYRY